MPDHNQVEELYEIIEDIKFAMFITMTNAGGHRACPMTTIKVDNLADGIWFIGAKGSDVVADISINDDVCLTYASPDNNNYVSLTAKAKLIDDQSKLDKLWSNMYEAFFDSKDDPNIQLIQVKPTVGEYWKGDSSIVSLLKMSKAAVTGQKVDDLGENHRVTFC